MVEELPAIEEAGATALVDSLISERAVVFGSLPPRGRDLDLLVSAADEAALGKGLSEQGFLAAGGSWARFRGCTVDVVDVVRTDTWGLPEDELTALITEARPLAETTRLAVPAPHHALLILARRLSRGGTLREHRLARIRAALDDDPDAFARARERVDRWGLAESLAVLERAYRDGRDLTREERSRARSEFNGEGGSSRARRSLRRAKRRLLAPRRGMLITFSGLDGSGKSSQTCYLRDTLDRLGYHAVAVWEPIANLPQWLRVTADVIKTPVIPLARLISRNGKPGKPSSAANTATAPPAGFAWPTDNPLTVMRRRSSLLTFAWSTAISVQFAYRLARAIWPQLARGRVVVCDRYLLDSWVYLLYKFGDHRRYRFQLAILRALSPKPRHAFFLDVPGAVASARKGDFLPERNARRAELYRARLAERGVRTLDGTQPPDELSAEIATEVWRSLATVG
jgi:thymidylate kinase